MMENNVEKTSERYKREIVWRNVVWFTLLHLFAALGLILLLRYGSWKTWMWMLCLHVFGGFGITAGAHRLWSHRTYTAKTPLRVILMLFNCSAFQNDIIEWSRDHRTHHKWTETDADPHNAKRGLFFSHIGWLLVRKHPDVIERGKTVDMSDLLEDKVLMFQRKHYLLLVLLLCWVIPPLVAWVGWGEGVWTSLMGVGALRYSLLLHATWTVNSLAHLYGHRPYDPSINPAENYFTVVTTLGEGYHNYHHTFPKDYRTTEFPYAINLTTVFIDCMAAIGWVSNRKTTDQNIVQKRKEKAVLMVQEQKKTL